MITNVLILANLYLIWQAIRLVLTASLFNLWHNNEDDRLYQYDFYEVWLPNLKNWFGLRLPSSNYYPNKF